ncbi:MAG: FHA domain-containing protein [Myxococcales bacterium]|nr:FHA domain-containing protein [Myxococcales bacterium]
MAVRMTVVNPVDAGDPYTTPQDILLEDHESGEIYIGRAPGNHVQLANSAVSGQHVRIVRQGDDFVLHDLGSRNGTSLNGERLPARSQKLLRSGDRINVVNYVITFKSGTAAFQTESTENTTMIALSMIKNVLGGVTSHEDTPPKLIVMDGPHHGDREFPIKGMYTDYTIGRSPHCEFTVHDENISREHAVIRRDPTNGVTIRDNGSRNGVIVNGDRLRANVEKRLRDRDEITIGTTKMSFSDPMATEFEEKFGAEEESAAAASGSRPSGGIPKPSSPPPAQPKEEEPSPADVAEAVASEDSEAPKEGEEGEESDGTEAPVEPPPPAGLDSTQKLIIGIVGGVGVLIVLIILVALLFM